MNFKEKLFDTNQQNKILLYILTIAGIYFAINGSALASGGEAEFGEIYQKLTDWAQGTLGKLISLTCIVVGMAIGVVKTSLIWVVIGIAMCLILYYSPSIIDSLMDVAIAPLQIIDVKQVTITNGLN